MSDQFSPGDWKLDHYTIRNEDEIIASAYRVHADYGTIHDPQRMANARLLVAAKELYHATEILASLKTAPCPRCESRKAEHRIDCADCGGIGEVVVFQPNVEDVKFAQSILKKVRNE